MIPYSHHIRQHHEHAPIYIERHNAPCKLEIDGEYQDMHQIPLIRDLVCILEETINPIDSQFINNESHRHIANQRRNIVV